MAVNTKIPVSTRPTTSMPRCRPTLCRSWCTTGRLRQRRRGGALPASSTVAISVPHPGVDHGGDDVDDEVRQGDDDRQQGDPALHGAEVARLQVVRALEAPPLPLERRLGGQGAAEEQRDL